MFQCPGKIMGHVNPYNGTGCGVRFCVLGKVCDFLDSIFPYNGEALGNTKILGKHRVFRLLQWDIDRKIISFILGIACRSFLETHSVLF